MYVLDVKRIKNQLLFSINVYKIDIIEVFLRNLVLIVQNVSKLGFQGVE